MSPDFYFVHVRKRDPKESQYVASTCSLIFQEKMDLSPAIPMDYGYHHGFENTNHRHHKPKA